MLGRAGVPQSLSVRTLGIGVVLAGLAAVNAACGSGSTTSTGYSGGGGSGGAGTPSSTPSSTQPALAIVDTNQTMTASPGQGVGVFVQYQSGGHWNIWWTCDTDKTGLPCNFDVTASVTSGTITNVGGRSVQAGDAVNQATSEQVEALTTTTTGVDGMTFDTPIGAMPPIVTVDARVDGTQSGTFLFFVQNAKINGDYPGTLTDPLMFEPSQP